MSNNFGYTIVSEQIGHKFRDLIRFTCYRCAAHWDMPRPAGRPSPQNHAKACARAGWLADATRANRCLCPKCQERSMDETAPHNGQAVPDPLPRTPTTDERVRIRGLLDKHFDDSVGCFLDEMSDQKIAEQTGVPRRVVENIREVGYGPIRVDAELMKLHAETERLKTVLNDLSKQIAHAQSELLTLASNIANRLR